MTTLEEFLNNNVWVRIDNYRNGRKWMVIRDGRYIVYSLLPSMDEGEKITDTDNIEAALEALK